MKSLAKHFGPAVGP